MISFFKKLCSIYSISPKRCRDLTDIIEELKIQLKKIGNIFGIRWVASSYRTMNAVWSNYQALYRHFQKVLHSSDTKSAEKSTYQGLVTKLTIIQFVEDMALLKDVLGQLSILLLNLQNDEDDRTDHVRKGVTKHPMDTQCSSQNKERNNRWKIQIFPYCRSIVFVSIIQGSALVRVYPCPIVQIAPPT